MAGYGVKPKAGHIWQILMTDGGLWQNIGHGDLLEVHHGGIFDNTEKNILLQICGFSDF